jgi:O-phospho-L-seryl-tRNASec:L-selenocysteinyl-tRNA synthase
MDEKSLQFVSDLVPSSYLRQGFDETQRRAQMLKTLLTQRCIPQKGWDEHIITHALDALSAMDSNNFTGAVGAGEREGRVLSPLVRCATNVRQ